ncbi:MAG: hypothetical protein G01um101419_336, partial [Parcubacteria group bacterium Gr01-1014_19]
DARLRILRSRFDSSRGHKIKHPGLSGIFDFLSSGNRTSRTPCWKALGNQKVSEMGAGVRRKCSRLIRQSAEKPLFLAGAQISEPALRRFCYYLFSFLNRDLVNDGRFTMTDFIKDILTLLKVFIAVTLGFFLMATWFGISHWNEVLFAILLLMNIALSTLMAVIVMIMVITLGEWIWLKIRQFFQF